MDDVRRVEPLWIEWPQVKIRREWSIVHGNVCKFVLQMEYDLEASVDGRGDSNWVPVARFDHDVDGPHDIREEGLHLDVYRDGKKYRRTEDFSLVSPNEAIAYCEQYFIENAAYLLGRFENWHGIRGEWAATRPRR